MEVVSAFYLNVLLLVIKQQEDTDEGMLRCLEMGMMWTGTMLCTREFLRICLWTRSCRFVSEISQQPLSA